MVRFLKRLVLAIIVGTFVLCASAVMLFVQDEPIVGPKGPPSPEDVMAVRTFVHDVRSAAGSGADLETDVQLSDEQLNSIAQLGARFLPDFRGEFLVEQSKVVATVSVPVPWIGGQKWLNLAGNVSEFSNGFKVDRVQIGAITVPPTFALWLLRVGGNLLGGNGLGDRVLDAPKSMVINDGLLTFQIELDEMGKNNVMRGIFGNLRGEDLPGIDRVVAFEAMIRSAMENGQLPLTGSFLPYLTFLLDKAAQDSTAETLSDNYTAAILALAKVCGAQDFAMIVGGLAFDQDANTESDVDCTALTLNGRVDSRRHFTTAAALQAASNRGFSVSVGEFKELYDTGRQWATGFDFTDLAANNAGIRLSDYMMRQPLVAWPEIIDNLEAENDVIIRYDGLPVLLTKDEFVAQYSDIDSPAYKSMLAEIEGRIDDLTIYQTR